MQTLSLSWNKLQQYWIAGAFPGKYFKQRNSILTKGFCCFSIIIKNSKILNQKEFNFKKINWKSLNFQIFWKFLFRIAFGQFSNS